MGRFASPKALKKTSPSGEVSYEYFDVVTGLKLQEESSRETDQGTLVQVITFGDYRDVDGIAFPYRTTISAGGQNMEGTVTSVRFNSGIEDSVFKE